MRLAAAIAAACCLTGVASAAVPQRGAYVITSSTAARAIPVALTVSLTFEMQCGNPGRSPLTLTLPPQMTVPVRIAASSVLVDGKPAKSVTTHGSKVTIAIAQPHFLTCDVIGMSTLTVMIGKRAGLGNPKTAGIYAFHVAIGPVKGAPKLRIT
jgi:hypothetical protein